MAEARDAVVVAVTAMTEGAQLLDVRWGLTDPPGAGRAAYRAGHLPGARFLDLEAVLTGPRADPTLGRHPLPSPDRLTEGLRALGVDPGRPIIVYDLPRTFGAGRAWWVLRDAGLDVRVLDGGLPAWVAAGGTLEQGDGTAHGTPEQGDGTAHGTVEQGDGTAHGPPEPGDASPEPTATEFTLTQGHLPVINADEAAAWPGTLIDVRAPERFRGVVEPLDPKAGHIPGAINRPIAHLWTADGRLPGDQELRDFFGELADPVAVYCGSGVSAAQGVLALAALGRTAALYAPSWSGWCADPDHPVAVGA